jgi:hypothetical protein
MEEVPLNLWLLLGGQFVAFVYAWSRALLNISNLKKENVNQNKTISAIYDKVSATREDVAEIKGMLGSRSRD